MREQLKIIFYQLYGVLLVSIWAFNEGNSRFFSDSARYWDKKCDDIASKVRLMKGLNK